MAEFFLYVEARAGFVGKFTVAVYGCIRIFCKQVADKRLQRFALLRRARVLRGMSVSGKSADIADAYAVRVVAAAVGADLRYRPPDMHGAVAVDYIMIAYAAEAPGPVPAVDVGHSEVPAFLCGAAVNDDFIDFTHINIHFVVHAWGISERRSDSAAVQVRFRLSLW